MLKRINVLLLLEVVLLALMLLAIGLVEEHPAASILCVMVMVPVSGLIRRECGEKGERG